MRNIFNTRKRKTGLTALAVVGIFLMTSAESCDNTESQEEKASERILDQFSKAQPIPEFAYSQYRQNLIEINAVQAEATATTSFMFLMAGQGDSGALVHECPSIGLPLPASAQLSNPQQKLDNHDLILPQIEPNGVYTGDSTGTYVMCIDPNGKAYAFYHEGFVATVTGPAHWDIELGEIVLDGAPTGDFTAGELNE